MSLKNRMSVSFSDEELEALDRIARLLQKSRAKTIRIIVGYFLSEHSLRFPRKVIEADNPVPRTGTRFDRENDINIETIGRKLGFYRDSSNFSDDKQDG